MKKEDFDLLESLYNLKMNILDNNDIHVEFELLHNQEDLEAILNSIVKFVVDEGNYLVIPILEKFLSIYSNSNQNLVDRVNEAINIKISIKNQC